MSYGYNNRTQMLRVPAPGRIEDRTVDGSCNPYLAATVMLAAGLDGIERELDPGDRTPRTCSSSDETERKKQGIEVLPANLLDATRELEATRLCGQRWEARGPGTTSTTTSASSGASGGPLTSRSPSGSSIATCSCF